MCDQVARPQDASAANALADRAVQRWRAANHFDSDSSFAERLRLAGMSESEFGTLLSLPVSALKIGDQNPPPWLEELSESFSRQDSTPDDNGPPGFLKVIKPLLNQFRSCLHEGVTRIARDPKQQGFDPQTVEEICFSNLLRRLSWMLGRTMVLELNVARLNGVLDGDTAEARFESFIRRLEDREKAVSLLQEYPVLARQVVICVNQWLAFSLEFLAHLSTDFSAICDALALGSEPGVLTQVLSEAGDRHRDGRSVLIAKFGSGFKIVYKPRPLQTDIHFNELLVWANEKGFRPDFRTVQLLDRGSYGWVEFIEPKDCASSQAVDCFYRRQGGNLALLYVLGATDFHHENLIAAGEHPVLLDLETLFTPALTEPESEQAHQLAEVALTDSVLRIGLLPHGTDARLDFCGLGTVEGRLSPIGIPQWERVATDEMRYFRQPMPMRGYANRPVLAGRYVGMEDRGDSIIEGFHDMYRLLQKQRQVLLSDNGPLAAFKKDVIRVVARPTLTYGHLLEESFHPDVLRDAADRDCLYDRLWMETERRPYLVKLISAEQMALQRCDIPIFTTRPCSRDLWTCSGQRIPEFLYESGLDSSMRRVRELNEDDLDRQLWVIQASLATQAIGRRIQRNARNASVLAHGSVRDKCLQAALAAGHRLEVLAARRNNSASWIGLEPTAKGQWLMVPLGTDLYDGLPGVALFLAYLGVITREDRFTGLARAASTTLQQLITPSSPWMQSIGGFSGCGGVIYALSHLSALWSEPELIERAEDIVRTLPDLIGRDEQLDIIDGAAGCILSLLSLYRISGNKSTLDIAIDCGDLLVARATQQEIGAAWSKAVFSGPPLTGFSHGAAGIAYTLTKLAAQSRQDRFRVMALSAMAYERSVFDAKLGGWPDFRDLGDSKHDGESQSQSRSATWCHGATGIGLGRLNMLQEFDDTAIRDEIKVAVQATLASGLGENQSLCHGALGNLEFLIQAAETLSRPDIRILANHFQLGILESLAIEGWICGPPLSVESPGLMTGLAGIGYGLLRLAEPLHVPSVLLLEPPSTSTITNKDLVGGGE